MKNSAYRPFLLTSFVLVSLIITGCRVGKQDIPAMTPLSDELEHSYIALMPEGEPEDIRTYAPLGPSVVAWGNDPVGRMDQPEELKAKMDAYKDLGIKLLASNVWMLTATGGVLYEQPEFQDAVCLDIEGSRIVPAWLVDGEYRGVRYYWGCTNHPLFRAQLIERAVAGITAGANMLHLDDHLGTSAAADHSGGCYCDYCMEGFRAWLEQHFSGQELDGKGIADIGTFDYRELLRSEGYSTREQYSAGLRSNEVPLREEFLVYQREAAAGFVNQLGSIADSIAGRDIPVGVNAWNLIPTQLATSHYADYFSNEVSHHGVEDLIPPMVYMLGTALGKPVFSTGTGEDWILVGENGYVTGVRRWIATAYAFGHWFMYSYNKWGFSEETGTVWNRIPVSTYEPLCRFIRDNAGLFDDYEPVMQVGVLYDNAACRRGDWTVREVCRELHYANIPAGLLVAGDEWLKFMMDAGRLEQFELVIVPEGSEMPPHLAAETGRMKEQGRIITWTGTEEVLSRVSPQVSLENNENVWILPRKIPGREGGPLVIHLLNQDYDGGCDSMLLKQDIGLFISNRLTGGRPAEKVTVFSPGKDPRELAISKEKDGAGVIVPELSLWAVLEVRYQR